MTPSIAEGLQTLPVRVDARTPMTSEKPTLTCRQCKHDRFRVQTPGGAKSANAERLPAASLQHLQTAGCLVECEKCNTIQD